MNKIRKEYITNPDFDPAKVANASSAAEGLCKWVLAMEIYDRVARIVAPKKERMQLAESELNKTLDHLKQKRHELKAVEERLLNLKQQFQEMIEKKEKLEFQVIYYQKRVGLDCVAHLCVRFVSECG
jgi:dynein heavy chain, axonemal